MRSILSAIGCLILYCLVQFFTVVLCSNLNGAYEINIQSIAYNMATLAILYVLITLQRAKPREVFSIYRIPWGAMILTAISGGCTALVTACAMELLPIPESLWQSYGEASSHLTEGNSLIAFAATAIVAPITEELIFRGVIYRQVRSVLPKAAAVIIATIVFSILHGSVLWIIYAFAVGCVMALVFDMFNSVIASIAFHMSFNIVGMYILPYIMIKSGAAALMGLAISLLGAALSWRGMLKYVREKS